MKATVSTLCMNNWLCSFSRISRNRLATVSIPYLQIVMYDFSCSVIFNYAAQMWLNITQMFSISDDKILLVGLGNVYLKAMSTSSHVPVKLLLYWLKIFKLPRPMTMNKKIWNLEVYEKKPYMFETRQCACLYAVVCQA